MLSRLHHWRKTKRITGCLLALWLMVTYVVSWFAPELNEIVVFGFPLGFYMGAQGSLFFYLAIVWYYCRAMTRLDAELGKEDFRE